MKVVENDNVVSNTVVEVPSGATFDEDAYLVEVFRKGREEAFNELYARYYSRIYALARGILLDADDAEDAVQEVFALVHRRIDRFDGRSRFSTWLFRVGVNRCIQESRKKKRHRRETTLNEAITVPQEEQEILEAIDPRIEAALQKLSPNDRALLTLFYWQEMPLPQIAESLQCRVNAVKTRLYRARERFRVHYEQGESPK